MGHIILVTGGGRSGKSAYAQKLAEQLPEPRAFLATCPPIDEEMAARIRLHQDARRDRKWHTIEESRSIARAIEEARDYPTLLVDCLTLWINNLLYDAEQASKDLTEHDIARECLRLVAACKAHPGTILVVTNEVGMGITPENRLARLYRDLVGRCNQILAEASTRVVLLVSGQPIEIKNSAKSAFYGAAQ
ncbi:MAG: bifunctional adenosylcobinamide kinase/adenosylcobinamide-phosphate guanylyltransferase [Acidobacteriota bacterium]|nr:bifunctional adenosylcobinamide kinase/adenosylcobinamide-phosphate guanylyltransferase [Acidobacteriota bacterium]